ncbi:MFS transporter [Chryseobacterium culicis]|uniref:Sugar phosphate permease n=1 Tax=Chryseobacterium culicis TaxID=680127 RepID=A0A1H6IKM8_CHRCI|nr:MFS transporter [Chryseobacterium culicis]SEH47869.1 Sugar phosphate permease [Chryseobacterium culicis]
MNTHFKFHYAYVIVFCCCLIMGVVIGLVMSCAGIFYTPVSDDLGVSKGDFGLYMTFVYSCSFFMLSVAGKMMDKFSARVLLAGGTAIVGLIYIGMSQFDKVWQFYVAGGLIGIVLSFLLYLSYPVLISRWFNSGVGFFIGLCSAASGIGGIVFNPIGGYLLQVYGWRTAYLIFGAIILIGIFPLLAVLLRDDPYKIGLKPLGRKEQEYVSSGMDYAEAIRSPTFYTMLVFAFLMISVSTLNLFLPTYITSVGFSVEQSSLVASAVMLGVTIGKLILGYINDKSPIAGVFLFSGCGILGFIFLLFGTKMFILIVIGAFLFGWAYAAVTVETALLVRIVFGTKDYSKIFSNISISLALGGAVMAGVWGYLADFLDFKVIFIIALVLLACAAGIGWISIKKSAKNIY